MMRLIAGLLLALICRAGAADTPAPPLQVQAQIQVLISVPDQKLAVVRDGELVARFPVSTSRFGTGDQFWSYKTPLGALKVYDKIGQNLPPGAVIRHRSSTGEVLPVNAPGRDPIVTRVIWLAGLQAQNKNARSRCIYIHGTPDERTIGTPVSWGCIRMRSRDVIQVFNQVPVGTVVSIIPARMPHMHKYEPPKVQPEPVTEPAPATEIAAANTPPAAKTLAAAKAPATAEKPAAEPEKSSVAAVQQAAVPLPPIGESPDHGSAAAWRALKGSFLLANLFGSDSDKVDDHHKKATQ